MRCQSSQSVTWDWIEREIARRIQGRTKASEFSQLLAKRINRGSDPKRVTKRKTFKEH
jgi:hypothetical protein